MTHHVHVFAEVAEERRAQVDKGYDEAHDVEYGVDHLVIEARLRLNVFPNSAEDAELFENHGGGADATTRRRQLITAIALLVAAVETIDAVG